MYDEMHNTGVLQCEVDYILFFFFFQAEDGIRDHCVTGVQTCALPICKRVFRYETSMKFANISGGFRGDSNFELIEKFP